MQLGHLRSGMLTEIVTIRYRQLYYAGYYSETTRHILAGATLDTHLCQGGVTFVRGVSPLSPLVPKHPLPPSKASHFPTPTLD